MKILKVFITVIFISSLSGSIAKADFTFGEPTKVPSINSDSFDGFPNISPDGLELYFASQRPAGSNACFQDIWMSKRSTIMEPWSEPVKLDTPVNTAGPEASPCISADGLSLYFGEDWPGYRTACGPSSNGHGGGDLWVSTRATKEGPWDDPVNLGPAVNSAAWDGQPSISTDGLSFYFTSERPEGSGASDLYVTTRQTKNHPWSLPVNLGPLVNTGAWELSPHIAPDGLSLFFSRGPGGDIFVTRRTTTIDPWGIPVRFDAVNSADNEHFLTFAVNSSTLYFTRRPVNAPGAYDIWQVEATPIVDFNGDGAVDTLDIYELLDHWGTTDNSLYDIAPAPLGDGIVDVHDLAILTQYIEPIDRTLIAHWAMDEAEGITAHDSVDGNDGYALGSPVWQPAGGAVGGAIQLDGVDDYIITGSVLKSAEWPFSVFAWVKGGAPNQAVISETMGANWLMVDAEGRLITELKGTGGSADSLLSQVVITDGNWHQIGFVWDGLHRTLFVDDVAVAEDTQEGLDVRGMGLYIGAGNNAASGTYWSGLIDDVRVYNRAVKP